MPEQYWGAIAKQVGTNETLHEIAPTKEELDVKLFGRTYPAAHGSVYYYRFTSDLAVPRKTKGDLHA